VYQLKWPDRSDQKHDARPLVAVKIATLAIPIATAMDVSPDGHRAVVLTYGDAYEYVRGRGKTWAEAFARPGNKIAMPLRRQGESICYGRDGHTLYLTSEKRPTPLFEVPVRPIGTSQSPAGGAGRRPAEPHGPRSRRTAKGQDPSRPSK
jgi:hypothetical protein